AEGGTNHGRDVERSRLGGPAGSPQPAGGGAAEHPCHAHAGGRGTRRRLGRRALAETACPGGGLRPARRDLGPRIRDGARGPSAWAVGSWPGKSWSGDCAKILTLARR